MSEHRQLGQERSRERLWRTAQRWLHCYPVAWRARYGEELADLILATSGAGKVPWSTRLDMLRSGSGERLRSFGLGRESPPNARVRAGALLTLCGFAIFLVGAAIFQRFAENWRELDGHASVAAAHYAVLAMMVLAPLAALAVLCGIVFALPAAIGVLIRERWRTARLPLRWAVRLTAAALASLALIAIWAHGLSASQRNGSDTAYEIGFSAMAIIYIACLAAWTTAALSIASRIELGPRLGRVQASLATFVALAMLAIAAAIGVWWATLASTVPWVLHGLALHGLALHGPASPVTPPLLLGGGLVALGAIVGACGSVIALHGSRSQRRSGTPQVG